MKKTYIISDNMISSLGFTTEEHLTSFRKGQTGISPFNDAIPFASRIDEKRINIECKNCLYIEGYDGICLFRSGPKKGATYMSFFIPFFAPKR